MRLTLINIMPTSFRPIFVDSDSVKMRRNVTRDDQFENHGDDQAAFNPPPRHSASERAHAREGAREMQGAMKVANDAATTTTGHARFAKVCNVIRKEQERKSLSSTPIGKKPRQLRPPTNPENISFLWNARDPGRDLGTCRRRQVAAASTLAAGRKIRRHEGVVRI